MLKHFNDRCRPDSNNRYPSGQSRPGRTVRATPLPAGGLHRRFDGLRQRLPLAFRVSRLAGGAPETPVPLVIAAPALEPWQIKTARWDRGQDERFAFHPVRDDDRAAHVRQRRRERPAGEIGVRGCTCRVALGCPKARGEL